jgi:O-antigen ligase
MGSLFQISEPLQHWNFRLADHKLPVVFCALAVWIGVTTLCQVVFSDGLEGAYLALAIVFALSSFALITRPYAILSMLLVYLASPAPLILDLPYSGVTAGIMFVNCGVGALLTGCLRRLPPFLPWKTCMVIGAANLGVLGYGLLQGNQLQYVLGDLYQLFEFGVMFFLTSILVHTLEQWRSVIYVLVGAVIATCIIQFSDALQGAHYLPHLAQAGINVPRTINLNSPIAFLVLLSLLIVLPRRRKFLLVSTFVVAGNLLMGFTRGVWLAAAFSAVIFLCLQERRTRRKIFAIVLTSTLLLGLVTFVGVAVTSTNILQVVEERMLYSVTQFESASDEEDLAGRRVIEFLLVGSQVAKHPWIGHGLGSTYEILGDAILQGPKGATVDHHYIHNLYLMIAFRLGIPALLIFLVLLWKYTRHVLRARKQSALSREDSTIAAALLSAVFGEMILSITSPTFFNHPTAGIVGAAMVLTLLVPGLALPVIPDSLTKRE